MIVKTYIVRKAFLFKLFNLKTAVMMLKIQLYITGIHCILKYIKQETNIRNCNNISQYYCFFLYFN